jgi:hypothetical protein
MSETRKIAAILVSDVVGCSRLAVRRLAAFIAAALEIVTADVD